MKIKRFKPWLRFIGFTLGIVTFVFAVHSIQFQALWSSVKGSINIYFVICVAAWILSIVFQTLRWQFMLRSERTVPYLSALKFYILNRISNLLIGFRTGEGLRIVAASKRLQIDLPFITATIINERILNVTFLVLVAFGLTFSILEFKNFRPWIVAALMIILSGGFWIIFRQNIRIWQNPKSNSGELSSQNRFKDFCLKFVRGLLILRVPSVLIASVLSSIAAWFCLWFGIVMLLQNLNTQNPYASALAVLFFTNIASLFPVTPSNIGPFQWGCILALSYFAVTKTEAVAFSIVLQSVRIVAALLMGVYVAAINFLQVHVLHKSELSNFSDD